MFSDCCKSFHIIYSTTLDYVDALLSNGSKLCLVDTKERLDQLLSSPFSHHQISVFVIKPLYTAKELETSFNHLCTKYVSVIQISSVSSFGEITAKCALQLKDASRKNHQGSMALTPVNNVTAVTKTLQTVPGLGPKHVNKLLSEFGSLFNITNASLGDLERVVGQVLAMTVYQFLH